MGPELTQKQIRCGDDSLRVTFTVDSDGYGRISHTQAPNGGQTVDLTPFAGKTAVNLWITADAGTPVGAWNGWFSEIAIYGSDGTVLPVYDRQASVGLSYFSGGGETGTQAFVERSNTAGDAEQPANTTTYYLSDQIGSTRTLTAGGGWPVSQDVYYPYGVEPQPPADANHYKFTGLERDAETGLDHAWFRQYGATMGRWLSPDPYNGSYDLANPQSFNRYAYVGNNPLAFVDPTGLYVVAGCSSCWGGGVSNTGTGGGDGEIGPGGIWGNTDPFATGGGPDIGYSCGAYCTGVEGFIPTITPGTFWLGFSFSGYSSTSMGFPYLGGYPSAPSNRTPNKITCGTVLPNGRTVGSYVNQLSNTINNAPQSTSTPYGASTSYAPGYSPLSVPGQVYSQTNFKINFRGQGNAAFLGDAGNFAYAAVSGNIGIPLFAVEAVAGGYALWAGHSDANGPYFMDASATAQIPAGYGAGCQGY